MLFKYILQAAGFMEGKIMGMVFYKWLALALVLIDVAWMVQLGLSGRKIKKFKILGRPVDPSLQGRHESLASETVWITLGTVVLIETLTRMSPEPYAANRWLLWTNIVSGILFFAAFVLNRLVFNGKNYPRLHSRLAYSGFVLAPIAVVTGLPMLYMLRL